jgi:class 3 adenylate cyclase
MHDPELRASDADRQVVVDRLSKAVGDGLLSLDEFADHAERAYAAKTRADLDELTRELRLPVAAPLTAPAATPAPAAPAAAAAQPKRSWVVAVMGGEDRRGRWRAGRRIGAFAFMGGVELDLRHALLEDDVIEITAWAVMGGVSVVVPEGIAVESSGFILMGGRSNRIKDVPILPGSPVIRVKGYGMWGGVDVRSKPQREPGSRRHRHGFVPPVPAMPPMPPMPPVPGLPGTVPAPPPPPAEPEAPPGYLPQAGLLTVVCTDLVGSTRLSDQLGDQRWRAVVTEHNGVVRDLLARHGGNEVKTSGDGFLCTFTSARRAVAFAADLQEAVAERRFGGMLEPLQLRIGVHAGEVERDGGDIVGRNVALTCRLCDVAAPGEVLVSSVVADLADSASDLRFGDDRTVSLAGIDRPVTARPATRR